MNRKKKNFSEAEHCFDEYRNYCRPYWEKYDMLFNYKFNKCGFCNRMKRALVKSKWSHAEDYPLYRQLVCVNKNCEFYLIINSYIERE